MRLYFWVAVSESVPITGSVFTAARLAWSSMWRLHEECIAAGCEALKRFAWLCRQSRALGRHE